MNKKIGILGGTFDPIHNGHINIALQAKEEIGLDTVIFIPNHIPPHKDFNSFNKFDIHRLNMIKIAIEPYPYFTYSNYEIEKKGVSYTYETIIAINNAFPHDELYFIMGDDSYYEFHKWKEPGIICKYATLVIGWRKNLMTQFVEAQRHMLEDEFNAKLIFLDNKTIDVSSSQIRTDRNIEEDVPDKVKEYIIKNKLYGYKEIQ